MIGKATPYIHIREFNSVVERHQELHRTIYEIHAVCNAKHSIDEIEEFLLHNAASAQQLLEHCKMSGSLPDGERSKWPHTEIPMIKYVKHEKMIHAIFMACNGKYKPSEIEAYLLHNRTGAEELLGHCKTTGSLPENDN